METINHECYVSLEIAKLLKKVGFNWEVKTYYHYLSPYDEYNLEFDSISTNYNHLNNADFSAPSLDVAQRWLRDVKGIYVESVLCVNRGISGHSFGFSIAEVSADLSIVKILYPLTYFDEEETKGFTKYELALEAGIKKALEMILKIKNEI